MRRPPRPLVRLFLVNGASGAAIAGAFLLALTRIDQTGIGALLAREPIALAATWWMLAVTFAAIQIGAAIMLLPKED